MRIEMLRGQLLVRGWTDIWGQPVRAVEYHQLRGSAIGTVLPVIKTNL